MRTDRPPCHTPERGDSHKQQGELVLLEGAIFKTTMSMAALGGGASYLDYSVNGCLLELC